MKIATFGCSWSQGLETVDNGYCWPLAIAQANPEWEIDNFALAGSSFSFQAYLLDDVLNKNQYDKIIFQITSPFRLTYFDDQTDYGEYFKIVDNYRYLDCSTDIYRQFICITPGHMSLNKQDSFWHYPDKYDFAKLHYKYTNKQISKIEYRALFDYVKSKTDFVLLHNEDVCGIGVPVLMDIVGDKFVADEGEHFNAKGSQWVANWVLDNL